MISSDDYRPPPLTPESRAIAVVHAWLPRDGEAVAADECDLIRYIRDQITIAEAVKVERIMGYVRLWERSFRCHDPEGEHKAMSLIAAECGGEIGPFRGIPAHK